ncbi:Wd40 repeat-containing protein, partial [Globisporangium splendens]
MAALQFYMQIQPDWQALAIEGEAAGEEQCWLDVYERSVRLSGDTKDVLPHVHVESATNAHFKLDLNVALDQRIAPSSPSSEQEQQQHLVSVTKRENQWIEVHAHIADRQQPVRTIFQAPTATMHSQKGAGTGAIPPLHTVDVSMDERFVAVGGADGLCTLWDALDRTESMELSGHLLDVTRVRFFPSSKVLLTGSLDFTLRIWSVGSGKCAAILKGHRGGIEDIAILGKGRNVMSSSSDGLIHLWSCGTQDVIAKWGNDAQSAVHCLSVLDDPNTKALVDTSTDEPHELEAETDGKVVFAGLDNGEILGVDIRARDAVLNLQGTASILSCAATNTESKPLLLTGSEDGILTTWDLRNTSSAPINRIVCGNRGTVWTAHGDSGCSNWSHVLDETTHTSAASISTELTGPQYDPIRDVAIAPKTGRVFTVCRDGHLRDYIPHFL